VHPDRPWETCLSAGNVVLRIVREGIIYDIHHHHKKQAEQDNRQDGLSRLDTIRFRLALKDDLVVLEEGVITGDETILKQKFTTIEMKKSLEYMASLFATEYLDERALDMFNYFKPVVDKSLDFRSTRNVFNRVVLHGDAHDYGALDMHWVLKQLGEDEPDF
jgi:hypothetical protein